MDIFNHLLHYQTTLTTKLTFYNINNVKMSKTISYLQVKSSVQKFHYQSISKQNIYFIKYKIHSTIHDIATEKQGTCTVKLKGKYQAIEMKYLFTHILTFYIYIYEIFVCSHFDVSYIYIYIWKFICHFDICFGTMQSTLIILKQCLES